MTKFKLVGSPYELVTFKPAQAKIIKEGETISVPETRSGQFQPPKWIRVDEKAEKPKKTPKKKGGKKK